MNAKFRIARELFRNSVQLNRARLRHDQIFLAGGHKEIEVLSHRLGLLTLEESVVISMRAQAYAKKHRRNRK